MKHRLAALFALAAVAFASLPPPVVGAGEQHRDAHLYAMWDFHGGSEGYWNIDQFLKVTQKAQYSFWAELWAWTNADFGGYVGLQTNGNRFDGTTGDTAIFSLWNATAASGPGCGTFGGEGSGYSCRLPFRIRTDRWYRLRVWRVDADEVGQWWGAWIKDRSTGNERFIGSIRVGHEFMEMGPSANFSEYFGPAVACDAVPVSIAKWTRPTANPGPDASTSRFGDSVRGACTGGSARPRDFGWAKGVRMKLGGPL